LVLGGGVGEDRVEILYLGRRECVQVTGEVGHVYTT
jgi:hypothetical protein